MTELTERQSRFLRTYLGVKLPDTQQDGGAAGNSGELVRKRKYLVERWTKVPSEISVKVDQLKTTIPENVPWESGAEVASMVAGKLASLLDNMREKVDDAVVKSINAGDLKYAEVGTTVGELQKSLSSDPFVKVVRATPFMDGAGVIDTFTKALDDIRKELTE